MLGTEVCTLNVSVFFALSPWPPIGQINRTLGLVLTKVMINLYNFRSKILAFHCDTSAAHSNCAYDQAISSTTTNGSNTVTFCSFRRFQVLRNFSTLKDDVNPSLL